MANIIGVKFRPRGKLVYCDAGEISLQLNDYVVVDTDIYRMVHFSSLNNRYHGGRGPRKIESIRPGYYRRGGSPWGDCHSRNIPAF